MLRIDSLPRLWRCLALACVAALPHLSCGPSETSTSGVVDLVYWRTLTGAAGSTQDELVERFNQTHTGIHVTSEFQGSYSDLRTKLLTAAAAQAGPDVTQLGTFEILELVKAGLLVDMKEFITGANGISTADWPGTLAEAGVVDGGVYWLPFNVSVPILYMSKEALTEANLAEPPKTWDDFYHYVRALTQRDANGKVQRVGLALWNNTWPLISAIWSEGGELTDRSYSSVTLNDPQAIAVLSKLQTLVAEGCVSMPDAASGGHRNAFKNGRAAMILDSPAAYDEIVSQAVNLTTVIAPYPAGKAGRVYAPGGGGLAMLTITPTERRAHAWKFIKFMTSPEQIAYYAEKTGYAAYTPQAQSLIKNASATDRLSPIYDSLPYVRGDFSINFSPIIRDAFTEAFQRIIVTGVDAKTALDEADARAEAELKRK